MAKWIMSADNELVNLDQCREIHIVQYGSKFQVRAEGAYFDSDGSVWWILDSFDTHEEALHHIKKLHRDLQGGHINFVGSKISGDDLQKLKEELKNSVDRSICDIRGCGPCI